MAYLYTAARGAKISKHRWEDMEFAISAQNRVGSFVLDSTIGVLGHARHLSLALGLDAQMRTSKPKLPSPGRMKGRSRVQMTSRVRRMETGWH